MKIGVLGCNGKMGTSLISALYQLDPDLIGGGSVSSKHTLLHQKDIASLISQPNLGIAITNKVEELFTTCHVLIDFTSPEASVHYANLSVKYNKPLVIGTTGFTADQMLLLQRLALQNPILHSGNMSLGITVMRKITHLLAKYLLNNNFQTCIIETHHKHKKDSPSGTAVALKNEILKAGNNVAGNAEVPLKSIRAGEVIGEHTVGFYGDNETITIKHTALNRNIFAEGAIKAALWLSTRPCGKLYDITDVDTSE